MEETRNLVEIMVRLRDPERGCSWDAKQSFESIAPYTIEEAYEVADAIARGDMPALRDELGDLLLQVVFHAQMASECGFFEIEDVAQSICDKMIRRHPHVFGDVVYATREQQRLHWEQLKHEERADKSTEQISAIDDVALALPALTRGEKIQKRAARVGFDWDSLEPVIGKLEEELAELKQAIAGSSRLPDATQDLHQAEVEDELGDVLFATTNVARHLGIDPEQAMKNATAKFEKRFRFVESALLDDGLDITETSEDVLDQYWLMAKRKS